MSHLFAQRTINPLGIFPLPSECELDIKCKFFIYGSNFYHLLYQISQLNQSYMQSSLSNQSKITDKQILRSIEFQQSIHEANLQRYQKIYKQYEGHLRQDLQRQKVQLQNSEIVEKLLIKLKKQIFDQLKSLETLQNKAESSKTQARNQNQDIVNKRDSTYSDKFAKLKVLQSIEQQEHSNLIGLERLIQERDSKLFNEQFVQLKIDVQKFKQLYSQLNQRLNQSLQQLSQPNYEEDLRSYERFQASALKKKLQAFVNYSKETYQTKQRLQFQLKKYKYIQEHQNQHARSTKNNRQSVSSQQEKKYLKEQLNKIKNESLERLKIGSFQRHQLELKLLLKEKQIQEYKHQLEEISQKFRTSLQETARLQVQVKQFRQIRDESNLLKMKLFSLQNMHKIQKELPFVGQNMPELIRSQIFNKNSKIISKEISKVNSRIQKQPVKQQILNQRLDKRHLKQDMIRQNLANSLKHYKKKYSELQKRLNEKEQQFIQFSEKSKQKISDYNVLIQKLHNELQKSYLEIAERSEQSTFAQLYRSFQQKIDAVSIKNSQISRQIVERQQAFNKQRQKYENEKKQLIHQLERITKGNSQLKKINRQSKSSLLQQQLNLDVWKSQNNSNISSEKTKSLIFSLNQQITLLRSQLQQKNDLLLKQTSKNERLVELNSNLTASLEEVTRKSSQMRQRNQQIQTKLHESSNKYSLQLQNTKEKLQLEQLSTHHIQKKLAHFINETKQYQIRVKQLEDALTVLAHQNQEKNIQIMRINHQKDELESRFQRLEQQIDILQEKGSSLKKIEFFNRSSQIEQQNYSLKRKYSETVHNLNLKQHQVQYLKSQCDKYIEQNLKYLQFIKQQGIQISEGFLNEQKQLEDQKNNKIKYLQQKNHNFVQDNQLLKSLVQQLRSKLNEKTMSSVTVMTSKHEDQIYQLRNALLDAQKTIEVYKTEIQELQLRCSTQKSIFKDQWNKLIAEYNERSKSQKNSQQNLNQSAKMQKNSSIQQLEGSKYLKQQLQRKQFQIKKLKKELQVNNQKIKLKDSQERFDKEQVPAYFKELLQLRQQIQKLKQQKVGIQNQLRELEQQNSSLKIKLISSNKYQSPSNKYQSPSKLSYHPIIERNNFQRNEQSNLSYKSVDVDEKVTSSLKKEQRQSQNPRQTKVGLFKHLASLAPLVESVRGEESFTRLSNQSKLSK